MIFSESKEEFIQKLTPILSELYKPDEKIAIKLHMGELGNKTFIEPEFVRTIVNILKQNNTIPFLFDSPVMYKGGRNTVEKYLKTAKINGFSRDAIGCDIVISNDFEYVKTPHLNAEVCKPLIESDGILVLSHVKGHMCSGFGAAIKNLGMGAVSTKTKADIHTFANPMVTADCTYCQTCVKACPVNSITAKAGKILIQYDGCWGCGQCINICPKNALKPRIASFDTLLSEAAFAVLKTVKKPYFINVMTKITKLCDCAANNGPIIAPDIGYLASDNIVEADKRALDMIIEKAGKNVFLKAHKKDPYASITEFEKLPVKFK